MAHLHSVYDTDGHFVIDPITRAITNSSKKIKVMQGDHKSEHFTFEISKLVDGHNMTFCNKVEIHYINIDASDKSKQSADFYEAKNLKVSENDNSVVTFLWELTRNATKYAGTLSFLIRFACTDDDGVEEYAWHTDIFQSIAVGNGMNNATAEVIEPYIDVIAQWKANLFGVGDTEEQRLLTVSAEQQAAIAAKGAVVLDSIPDEYEALSALADQNHRNKAGAIVLDAEGESIVVNDASEYPLQNLKVFGKSTQDGTPTPDAPVDIVSVEAPVVTINSKNLLKITAKAQTLNGVTFTVNEDGSFTAKGTSTGDTYFGVNYDVKNLIPGKLYCLNGCPNGGGANTYRLYAQTIDGATFAGDVGSGTRFTAKDGQWQVLFAVYRNVTVNLTVYPMLRLASVEDATFEPYNSGSVAISTPTSLPGIPVSSGGNYTDANGQQWICDEVDLARGVYVQRIGKRVLSGSDSEHWGAYNPASGEKVFHCYLVMSNYARRWPTTFCNRFRNVASVWERQEYGLFSDYNTSDLLYFSAPNADVTDIETWKMWLQNNPTTILYLLATPIETPLSDAEITAFKALHSNRPNTTILNDAGAHMAVSYVADTKTYIDNKIAEMMKGVTE